jgi:hypothetical protein
LVLFASAFAWVVLATGLAIAASTKPVMLVRELAGGPLGSVAIGAGEGGDAVASWSERPLVRAVVRVADKRAGRSRWAISVPLSEGENPRLAVDGRGDAVAIWTSHLGPGAPTVLEAAVRPARVDHWLAQTAISTLQPADEGESTEATPSVTIGARGEVLIVWSAGSEEEPDTPLAVEPGRVIQAVSGSARTGRFDPAATLSRGTDFAQAPQPALDVRGDAVVVWEAGLRSTVFEGRAIQAAWRPAGEGWHQPNTVARTNDSLGKPHVAIDADGRSVAVWERERVSATPHAESQPTAAIESAFGNASTASWGAVQQLSPVGEHASNVQLASGPTGRTIVAWERDSRTSNAVVAASASTGSRTWGTPSTVAAWDHIAPRIRICPRGAECPIVRRLPTAAPQVATNAHGDAALVWEQAGGYRPFVRAASWPATARNWLAPVRVSAPGASEANVAVDGSDDTLVIWQALGECTKRCQQTGPALEVAKLPRAGR